MFTMNFTPSPSFQEPRAKKHRKPTRKQLVVIVSVATVLIAAISSAAFFFAKYNSLKQASSSNSQDLQERISKKVAMHFEAPNETPTIAQINNQSQLQKQQGEFFNNAQNGDYLVIYPKKQIAVIYREGTDRIINTGPIDLQSQNNGSSDASTQGVSNPINR